MNAFTQAWNFLKADPEMQIAGRGTAPPSIRGMMGRRRQLFTPEQMTPQPLDRQGRPHTHEEYMEGPRGVETPQRFEPTPEWFTHQREEPQGKEVSGRPLTDVSRPVEPFREHLDTNPEESFLTPSERFQADPSLAANLRRIIGGQQRGEFMGPLRHKLDTQQGIARGMRVKPHVSQFEEKKPTLTAEQKEEQDMDNLLAEMAAMTGGQVTHTPLPEPEPVPKEKPDLRGGVGAVARRAAMDEKLRMPSDEVLVEGPMAAWQHDELAHPKFDPNWALTAGGKPRGYMVPSPEYGQFKHGLASRAAQGVNPRQAQAMAGGDMEEMDFGLEGQPLMGQQGLRERLFQIANEKAREKHRAPEPAAPTAPSEIQAMQSEIDRRA